MSRLDKQARPFWARPRGCPPAATPLLPTCPPIHCRPALAASRASSPGALQRNKSIGGSLRGSFKPSPDAQPPACAEQQAPGSPAKVCRQGPVIVGGTHRVQPRGASVRVRQARGHSLGIHSLGIRVLKP